MSLWFGLTFAWWWMFSKVHVFVGYLGILFHEVFLQIFCTFLLGWLSFYYWSLRVLGILDVNSLSDTCIMNIFTFFIAFSFFFNLSFSEQNGFSTSELQFLFFFFYGLKLCFALFCTVSLFCSYHSYEEMFLCFPLESL